MYDRFLRVASSVKTVTWIRQSYSRIHRPLLFFLAGQRRLSRYPCPSPCTFIIPHFCRFVNTFFKNFSKYFFSRCLSVYYYAQIPRFEIFCFAIDLPLLYHRFGILSRGFLKFSEKIFGRCLRVYNIMNAPAFSDFQKP